MEPTFDRRRFVLLLGALAVPHAFAADLVPTPSMTEGPFYPRRFPADTDGDLTRIAGAARPAEGQVLDVAGRVLDRSGRPRAGARLEVWQCDAWGEYHHVGGSEGDPGFQGYGAVTTDAEGRYAFRTIRPVPYPGRTPHIHFTVVENGRRRLTSQMFVEGDPGNERDFLYRQLAGEARRVTLRLEDAPKGSGAALKGALDVVLA